MKRRCFLFRAEWIDALVDLQLGESRGEHLAFTSKQVMDAIIDYGLCGICPSIERGYNSREFDSLFSLIAHRIDEDLETLRNNGLLDEEE